MILGILVLCATMIDIITNVGHLDPIFHGPVILPYILNVICFMNIIISSPGDEP